MKKAGFFVLASIFLSFLIINSLNFTSAADSLTSLNQQMETLNDNLTSAQNKIDSIPKTPDEIRNRYLNQEWNIIISKNKIIGPIHNFFVANPGMFIVIFKEPYSFSSLFFATVFLWILIAYAFAAFFNKGINNEVIDWLLGAVTAVIISQQDS